MTKEESQAAYRAAWHAYLLAKTPEGRRVFEKAMDQHQEGCVDSKRAGPEWEAFIATLPGYKESWARFGKECALMIDDLERRLPRGR